MRFHCIIINNWLKLKHLCKHRVSFLRGMGLCGFIIMIYPNIEHVFYCLENISSKFPFEFCSFNSRNVFVVIFFVKLTVFPSFSHHNVLLILTWKWIDILTVNANYQMIVSPHSHNEASNTELSVNTSNVVWHICQHSRSPWNFFCRYSFWH